MLFKIYLPKTALNLEPISKKVSRTNFSLTGPEKRGSPAKTIRPPIAKGPKITPASISPITSGSFILLKISANIFAVTINRLIAKIVVITVVEEDN